VRLFFFQNLPLLWQLEAQLAAASDFDACLGGAPVDGPHGRPFFAHFIRVEQVRVCVLENRLGCLAIRQRNFQAAH